MRFYKSKEIHSEDFEQKINLALKHKKYFFIHQGEKQWHLSDPSTVYENGQMHIKGNLRDVGNLEAEMMKRHERNLIKDKDFTYSPRFGKKNTASHQIHLYIYDFEINENQFSIPLSLFTKIVDYNTAFGASVFSHIVITLLLRSMAASLIFR